MKGHIKERSPGHWAIVLAVRDPMTGKYKRRWHTVRGGLREAQRGHSNPNVTLAIYAHLFAKSDSAAAAVIDEALG